MCVVQIRFFSVTKDVNNNDNARTFGSCIVFEIDDYYDWDPQTDKDYSTLFQGNVLGNIADILPEYLYVMHNAGFARNYTNYGWIKCKVIWNKNDMKVTGKYEIENI